MTLSKLALIVSLGAAAAAVYAIAYVIRKAERSHYTPIDTLNGPFFPIPVDQVQFFSKRAPMMVYPDLMAKDSELLRKIGAQTNVQITVDKEIDKTAPTFTMTLIGKPGDATAAETQIDDLLLKLVNKKHQPYINKSSTNQS